MQPLALAFSSVRNLKEDTLGQVKSKADRSQELRQDPVFTHLGGAADLHVAAFLLPKTGCAPAIAANCTVPTSDKLWQALAGQETPAMVEPPSRPPLLRLPLAPGVSRRDGSERL